MLVRSWCAALLLSLAAGGPPPPAQRERQARQHCEARRAAIPANVDAGVLAPDMEALLTRSDTFRAQCVRIAAASNVHVTLAVVTVVENGRAQTAIRRYTTGALIADVELMFGENYRELLAHEFEHIIEQMDGVNLREEAARGRAWLLPGGAFETRRALAAGVQALREADAARASVTAPAPMR